MEDLNLLISMENLNLLLPSGRQWSYDYIPEDIMFDIFCRLPVESVLECRQVCKTWRNLLPPLVDYNHSNHSYFLDRNLQYFHRELQLLHQQLEQDHQYEDAGYDCLANATNKISLVFMGDSNDKNKHQSLHYVEYDENDEQSYKHTRTFNISLPSETPLITVGSCNGLVCLTTKISESICGRVYICNPITRECVELPRLFEKNNEYRDAGIRILFYGFGYVPSTNEYKVVRIIYKLNSDGISLSSAQVQVYTLGDNLNRWRDKKDIYRRVYKSHGLHVNGSLYWDVFPGDQMMSFDLLDEDFHFIQYPPKTVPSDWGSFVLANLGGQLCVFRSKKPSISCAEVWVLNKKNKLTGTFEAENVQERYSWTKKLTVSMNWEIMHRPFAIFKSGQILLWCKEKNIVAHDLKSIKTTELGDLGTTRPEEDAEKPWAWRNYDKAVVHSNSFVSLKRLGENATVLGMITD